MGKLVGMLSSLLVGFGVGTAEPDGEELTAGSAVCWDRTLKPMTTNVTRRSTTIPIKTDFGVNKLDLIVGS